jgi:CRP-like cAMP-binding protein
VALVQRIPWFQDIAPADLANVAVRMQLLVVPEHQVIIRQGEAGDHMYFIAHTAWSGYRPKNRAHHGT